jgi:hypothetical protein
MQEATRRPSPLSRLCLVLKLVLLVAGMQACLAVSACASCAAPANPIEAENCLPGNPSSEWYIAGAGSSSIQGFATDISVNLGQTIFFKVATNALSYEIDIYRLGYYQGNGARKVASILPSAQLPQSQPACLTDNSTGLTDCGNWAVSASWAVPSTATSGIYFARLVRLDTGEASPVIFIVRNDASHSDILLQTCDPTWEAYNDYGGSSLYTGPAIRAFKVSYNRPFNVPNDYTWPLSAEYPMVRWLEANGYDVSYFSGVDTDRYGKLITQHKVFISSGHDEYWSGGQRANVEAARAAGVNLAFFSGNEVWWKTRWEPSIDGTNTAYRTLVCYKETLVNGVIDPADPPTWTGIWRDPSFSPPADGGRPENALTGTSFAVDSGNDAITVPQADGKMRFWRNTSIATLGLGQTATLPTGVLGYEWDIDADNGSRPAGLIPLSTTTLVVNSLLLHDNTFGNGIATHQLTLYRAPSGALVFGAGTVQWSWGLDSNHDNAGTPTDPDMQQATVNLLADMGVQPKTLQGGLVPASASTDTIPPSSRITSPSPGSVVTAGSPTTISGTAADSGGGVVGAVEVSIDGGKTWHPASGRETWSYTATFPITGSANVQSRAVDDSGNLEVPGPGVTVSVGPAVCPCTIWPSTASPVVTDAGSYSPLELGVHFSPESNGYITGIRFYKGINDTGAHVGNLWSNSGTLLASAAFPLNGEASSGWQQVNFPSPVPVTANTMYVASYHTTMGHFGLDHNYFVSAGVGNAPLHAPANGAVSGGNGVYAFSTSSVFPTQSFNSENYWVDVVFNYSTANLPLSIGTTALPNGVAATAYNQNLAATGGTAPYSWSLISGALPAGLNLSASGQISGTPTTAGTSNFTVQAADSSIPAQTATRALSITITASTGPISVSITPTSSNLLVTGVQMFTATVVNDAANAGVTWSVAPAGGTVCSGIACGTLSSSSTASGAPTTYSAPSSAPAGATITITATSVTDGSKSASATVRIISGVNNGSLSGDYAFSFSGIAGSVDNSSAFTAVGRFTADGAGNITMGEMDTNGIGGGAAVSAQTFSGNYAIGADNRGVMTLNFGEGSSAKLAFAMMSNGNARFIKFDAADGSGTIGSGTMEKVDATAFSTAKITGDYAFGFAGLDNLNNRAAIAGRFTANGTGSLTGAAADVNAYGSVSSISFTSANYSVTDTGTGRGTMNFSFQFGGGADSLNFVFYIVNSGKLFVMESDPVSTATPLLAGSVLQQQTPAGGFTNGSLNGNMVMYLTGLSACSGITGLVPKAVAGLLTGDGNGGLSLTFDENYCRAPNSVTGAPATYSAESNGRVSMALGSDDVIAYLVNSNEAFLFSTDTSVLSGFGEPQAAGPLTNTAVKGTYAGLAATPAGFGVSAFSGEFTADGGSPTGNINGVEDIGATSGPISGAVFQAAYSISSTPTNGRGSVAITSGSGGSAIAYVISPSKFVMVPLSDANPAVWIFEQSLGTSQAVAPTITTQPANQSVTAGQNATFTVAATGTAPLAYQWRKNDMAISGATSASYTTPATASSDNGAQFTVVVGNAAGSVTSNAATLTVAPPLPTITSLTLNPTNVIGGVQSSIGTVTLSGPAPAGGAQVLLSSSNPSAGVPASVTVPAGATSATFTVSTSTVLISTSATISATYNNTTKTATLGVLI